MKVFITGTPAVEIKLINSVVDLLSKVKGPISYHAIEPLEKESVQLVVRQFDEDGIQTEKLEFDELINISQLYRLKYNVDKDDVLVILTSIQMVHQFNATTNKNWFSYYRGNNIVVKTVGWERFVDQPGWSTKRARAAQGQGRRITETRPRLDLAFGVFAASACAKISGQKT